MKQLVEDAGLRCDRCGGTGYAISHVHNGEPVPHRPENGICYRCDGNGREPMATDKQITRLKNLEASYKIKIDWATARTVKECRLKILNITIAIEEGNVKRREVRR